MANPTTLNDLRQFFGIESAAKFRAEWMALTTEDRDQIKAGIADGTYTYA
jgi:hypothetical protein